ncbi:Asp23/Gls24 family envelope stress response protein [Aminicella lysinilytica]|uniref:Putative alkaline shock family protein YloU n=1 Tax=Aminicella lysinilytica TaxID=433323 RepID=A0A4R6Q8F0_9FIRM|nr:Asp23/Gls24 family envelope stress response protein [Aminicella lysinilytica]TDP58531.1 putative alkaline shock family protein YloU [Aminicella lysinilytica]
MSDSNRPTEEELMNIAVKAATSVDGVSGMGVTLTNTLKSIPVIGTPVKGVKFSVVDEKLVVDLYIKVIYKVKIPQLAWDIQSTVKKALEEVIGSKIKEINIHVQGVDLPEEEDK